MDSKLQHVLTDEMLSFLYSSTLFQSFDEQIQQLFIEKYSNNVKLQEMLNVALELNAVIEEVEKTIPPLTEEIRQFFAPPKKSIIERAHIEKNVIFYPFDQYKSERAPLFVCLQQGSSMQELETFCKGMMLPLLDLCFRQKRNLVLIVFAEKVLSIQFDFSKQDISIFDEFININLTGKANIHLALAEILSLMESYQDKDQIELLFVSNNDFSELDQKKVAEFGRKLNEWQVSTSAVAMSEKSFATQPLPFVERIFFINE